jgi:hypothetical protein
MKPPRLCRICSNPAQFNLCTVHTGRRIPPRREQQPKEIWQDGKLMLLAERKNK